MDDTLLSDDALQFWECWRPAQNLPGTFAPTEAALLFLALQTLPEIGAVVEVGCYRGRSTSFIARTLKTLGHPHPFYSIDTFADTKADWRAKRVNPLRVYQRVLSNLQSCDVLDRVKLVRGLSPECGDKVPEPVAMLFIDGDHSYEGAKADAEYWLPRLVPGGWACFHDAHYTAPYFPDAALTWQAGFGVWRALKETVLKGGYTDIRFNGMLLIARKETL